MKITRRAALLPLLAAPALRPTPARAQAWRPAGGVRIVVPAAPGGTTDIMARLCAQHLSGVWGSAVVVENRAGGGGTIGTLEVMRARPDGLTLLSGNIGPQAIAYSLFRNLAYRAEQLAPVAGQIRGPNVLVVLASSPVRSVPDFAAWLREGRGRVSYAWTGVGQSTHLAPVWLLQLLEAEAIHVPFRGSGPAQTELLAGNVGFLIDNLTGIMQQVLGGRVRALAVTGAERSPQLPEVPTLRESLPELAAFDVNTWFGLFCPAGVAPEAIGAINAGVQSLLALPDTQRRFAELGGAPMPGSSAEFGRFVEAETAKWRAVIRREGLQLDAS